MIIENIYVTESNSKDTDSLLQNNSHFGRLSPKFEDFVKGTPVWLTNISNTILEAYDSTNRRHIKIIRGNKRLRYLTSIISDKWEEIYNVPEEMDVIIWYLISNRANLAFTNES